WPTVNFSMRRSSMMILRRIAGGTAVVAILVAAGGHFEDSANAGCRGRRCTTTLCFPGGCCYSPPPYSDGNPYESGSGNFWGVNHYCRQYGFLHANRCDSPCGPGNTSPSARAVPIRQPSPVVTSPSSATIEPKQPAQ